MRFDTYRASEKYYKQYAHIKPQSCRAPVSYWVAFKKAYPGGRSALLVE